jgi:hypothetical protein
MQPLHTKIRIRRMSESIPLCLFRNQLNLFLFPRGSNSDLCGSRALVAAARALLPPKARVGL